MYATLAKANTLTHTQIWRLFFQHKCFNCCYATAFAIGFCIICQLLLIPGLLHCIAVPFGCATFVACTYDRHNASLPYEKLNRWALLPFGRFDVELLLLPTGVRTSATAAATAVAAMRMAAVRFADSSGALLLSLFEYVFLLLLLLIFSRFHYYSILYVCALFFCCPILLLIFFFSAAFFRNVPIFQLLFASPYPFCS